jgi:hypothetical protein
MRKGPGHLSAASFTEAATGVLSADRVVDNTYGLGNYTVTIAGQYTANSTTVQAAANSTTVQAATTAVVFSGDAAHADEPSVGALTVSGNITSVTFNAAVPDTLTLPSLSLLGIASAWAAPTTSS